MKWKLIQETIDKWHIVNVKTISLTSESIISTHEAPYPAKNIVNAHNKAIDESRSLDEFAIIAMEIAANDLPKTVGDCVRALGRTFEDHDMHEMRLLLVAKRAYQYAKAMIEEAKLHAT